MDDVKALFRLKPFGDLGLVFQNARIARAAAIDEHPGQGPGCPAGIAGTGVPVVGEPRHDPGALLLCADARRMLERARACVRFVNLGRMAAFDEAFVDHLYLEPMSSAS